MSLRMSTSLAAAASCSRSGSAVICDRKGRTVWPKDAQSATDLTSGSGSAILVSWTGVSCCWGDGKALACEWRAPVGKGGMGLGKQQQPPGTQTTIVMAEQRRCWGLRQTGRKAARQHGSIPVTRVFFAFGASRFEIVAGMRPRQCSSNPFPVAFPREDL